MSRKEGGPAGNDFTGDGTEALVEEGVVGGSDRVGEDDPGIIKVRRSSAGRRW